MKPMALLLGALLAAHGVPSLAQAYKCAIGGKSVISDQPCSGSIKGGNDNGSASASPSLSEGPKETGGQNCKTSVKKAAAWKDPESLRIGEIGGGDMEVIDYADRKIGARRYSVQANAKNSNGGYVGDKRIICFTSQDGMRILKIDGSLIDQSTIN